MRLKIKGLVINEKPQGESDKLLTLLTENMGVITVKAKGVRKISAAFIKSAQLFAFSELLLYEKNGFYTMTEASLVTDFYSIREDIVSYALACYVCETAAAFSVPGESGPDILKLALNTLYAIENSSFEHRQIKSAYEIRLCSISGFMPDLDYCAACGAEFDNALNNTHMVFSERDNTFLCSDCGTGMSVTNTVLLALRHITCSEDGKFMSFRIDNASMSILNDISEKYLLNCAERGFNTLAFYKKCTEL